MPRLSDSQGEYIEYGPKLRVKIPMLINILIIIMKSKKYNLIIN